MENNTQELEDKIKTLSKVISTLAREIFILEKKLEHAKRITPNKVRGVGYHD